MGVKLPETNRFRFRGRLLPLILLWGVLFLFPGASAQETEPAATPSASPNDPYPLMVPRIDGASEVERLEIRVAEAIEAEETTVADLRTQLQNLKGFEKRMATEINGYHLQLSSNANLLASPEAGIGAIERARASHLGALARIEHQLAEIAQRREAVRQRLVQAESQYQMNQEQMTDINAETADPARTQAMVEKLQRVIRLLGVKINLLESIEAIYTEALTALEALQASFLQLVPEFEETLQQKRKAVLFERTYPALFDLTLDRLQEALAELEAGLKNLFTREYWIDQFRVIQEFQILLALSFFLVLTVVEYLLLRLRRYCHYLDATHHLSDRYPWRHFALSLLQRSLLLAGFTACVYAYANIRGFYHNVPFIRAFVHILFILLCCRWGYDFIDLWNERRHNKIPVRLVRQFRLLLFLLGGFAVGYRVLIWLVGDYSVILSFARILFILMVLFWGVFFWRVFRDVDPDAHRVARLASFFRRRPPSDSALETESTRIGRAIKTLLIAAGDVIWGGALMLELIGYGSLALYWLISWGRTAVIGLWAILAYKMLREWGQSAKAAPKPLEAEPSSVAARASIPLRWLSRKLSWILWGVGLVLALIFAWRADQQFVISLYRMARHSFDIGGLEMSLMGILNVILILLVIHAITRIWRSFLLYQLLADSGLDAGLKHSITIITIYLIWGVGIIIALNALGVGATSLAVAFGALSLGLGFGLQNIFSNFVSGIILLFERPIQVGDAVEVNGVWGEVRKINVRSTVVKTYDNAALIIPNSDFVSSQVTNWSFKDMRIRRIIKVKVAYGSDIERVRQLLLEIPHRVENVLKYPRPVVLFTEFGESGLDFQLRVWTDIDNMLTVDSNIRFEIDRQFRENGIRIPFPQRDVHLHPREPLPPTSSPERRGDASEDLPPAPSPEREEGASETLPPSLPGKAGPGG